MPDSNWFLSSHPRPQLRRPWTSLNGAWEFALDPDAAWSRPEQVLWDRTIWVPFAPETAASGIAETDFYRACWYRRRVTGRGVADASRAAGFDFHLVKPAEPDDVLAQLAEFIVRTLPAATVVG